MGSDLLSPPVRCRFTDTTRSVTRPGEVEEAEMTMKPRFECASCGTSARKGPCPRCGSNELVMRPPTGIRIVSVEAFHDLVQLPGGSTPAVLLKRTLPGPDWPDASRAGRGVPNLGFERSPEQLRRFARRLFDWAG